jgi:DNA replication protein DnaC
MNADFIYPDWFVKNDNLIKVCQELVKQDHFAVMFVGVPGCGKTVMAGIMFDMLCKQHKNCWALSAHELYTGYLKAINSKDEDKSILVDRANNCMLNSLVLLDDLGCEMDTDSSRTYFANILSIQYDNYNASKFNRTIITTNLDSEQIQARYGLRVLDRIYEHYQIVKFHNGSFRKAGMKKVIDV